MNGIRIQNLTKQYKNITAVDGLCLEIPQGELFSLLGVNGAGKTTTIKMLCCLAKPDGGDAWILGSSIMTQPGEVKQVIAVSPQENAVAPNLTVRENLLLVARIQGVPQPERRVDEIGDQLSLASVMDRRAGKLSGGWQRRLSIAMALVGQPRVLFLDEPTLGLDVIARSELWELIRQLKGKITMVLTTHYMEEAEALSDRIGIMKDGKLLTVGSAQAIKAQAGTDRFEDAFVQIVKGAGV